MRRSDPALDSPAEEARWSPLLALFAPGFGAAFPAQLQARALRWCGGDRELAEKAEDRFCARVPAITGGWSPYDHNPREGYWTQILHNLCRDLRRELLTAALSREAQELLAALRLLSRAASAAGPGPAARARAERCFDQAMQRYWARFAELALDDQQPGLMRVALAARLGLPPVTGCAAAHLRAVLPAMPAWRHFSGPAPDDAALLACFPELCLRLAARGLDLPAWARRLRRSFYQQCGDPYPQAERDRVLVLARWVFEARVAPPRVFKQRFVEQPLVLTPGMRDEAGGERGPLLERLAQTAFLTPDGWLEQEIARQERVELRGAAEAMAGRLVEWAAREHTVQGLLVRVVIAVARDLPGSVGNDAALFQQHLVDPASGLAQYGTPYDEGAVFSYLSTPEVLARHPHLARWLRRWRADYPKLRHLGQNQLFLFINTTCLKLAQEHGFDVQVLQQVARWLTGVLQEPPDN